MKRCSKYKNPAEKVRKKHSEKNYNAFTQTKNDNNRIVINDLGIQDNIEKDQNGIKNTKLDNTFQTSCKVSRHSVHNKSESSDTDCSNTNITTVSESNDIINKKAATFIKKVLHNELPKNNKQLSLVLLIQSRRLAKLSQLHFEDEVIKKSTEIFSFKSRYAKQKNDISILRDLHHFWTRKFQNLTKYVNGINDYLDTLVRLPNTAVKHVRNVETMYKPLSCTQQLSHVSLYNLPNKRTH